MAQDEFSSVFMAAMKLAGSNIPEVDQTLQRVLQVWQHTLAEHLDDPVVAKLVHLVGDGLYLHAIVGSQQSPDHRELVAVVRQLLRLRQG